MSCANGTVLRPHRPPHSMMLLNVRVGLPMSMSMSVPRVSPALLCISTNHIMTGRTGHVQAVLARLACNHQRISTKSKTNAGG